MKQNTIILPADLVKPFFNKKWHKDKNFDQSIYLSKYVNLSENSIFNKLLPLLDSNDNILDLGCGDGRLSLSLASKQFKNISAWDFSEEAISRLNHISDTKHYQINTKIIDINKAHIDKSNYNLVICASTLHYFNDLKVEKLLKKINNALKKSGIIYLTFETELKLSLADGTGFAFSNQPKRTIEDSVKLTKNFFEPLGYKIILSKTHKKIIYPTLPTLIANKLKTNEEKYTREMKLYEVILQAP